MQKPKADLSGISLEKLASISNSKLRDALCDAELKSCQRKLQKNEITESVQDTGKIIEMLKARLSLYSRIEEIYVIKKDAISAEYYRLIENAIKAVLAHEELSDKGGTKTPGKAAESALRNSKRE